MYKNRLFHRFRAFTGCIIVLLASLCSGCSTLTDEQRLITQQKLKLHTNESIAHFIKQQPNLASELDAAYGYMLCDTSRLMLIALGGQTGLCLLNDGSSDTILDLNSVNIGVGLGSTNSQFLTLFKSQQALEAVQNGHLSFELESLSKAGEQNTPKNNNYAQQIDIYSLNNQGAVASLGVGMVSLTVNKQLNTPEFAAISIPNKTALTTRKAKAWPYKMPFLADEVIAEGYKLPKPYAVGVTFAKVEQQMDLTQLKVGFNGDTPIPFQFVEFDKPITNLTTTQIKADMWLFPFMNVYAMFGKVNGDIKADVLLDGNLMLAHLDKNCDAFIKPIACRLLENKDFVLPIRTKVDPITYGLGTTLAAGWNDWFFALPLNITWSEPENSLLDGNAITITPRGGRVFNLKDLGRISVFVGGNYLDSENYVKGQISVPEANFTLDFEIEQANTDRWNMIAGFNWDISSSLSWNLEYNGFAGSRDALISGLTVRF